jgi:hypothetical protein
MKTRSYALAATLLATGALLLSQLYAPGPAAGEDGPKLALERVWPDLEFDLPTHLTSANDGTGRLFICEQGGTVAVVDPKGPTKSVYLDLRAVTRKRHNEEGLLSVAFHPKFKEYGKLYVAYSFGK